MTNPPKSYFKSILNPYGHVTLAVLLSCALVNRSLRSGEKDATLSFSASRRKVTLSK